MIKKLLLFLPLIIIFYIFLKPISANGLVAGGDWTFPYSNLQLKAFSEDGLNLWSYREIPTGTQIPHQNLYLVQLVAGIASITGMEGFIFQKIAIGIILISIFYSSFFLFYRVSKEITPSMLGSFVYLFSPVVFNYFNMGWIYVLLFMAISPVVILLWLKYIETGNLGAVLGIGVLSAIGFSQSQTIFWLPLILLACTFGVLKRGRIIASLKTLVIGLTVVASITFLVHMDWIIPTFLHPEPYLSAPVSAVDLSRFGAVDGLANQLRSWGSLFNSDFELSFNKDLQFATYVFIFMAIILLINNKSKQDKFVSIACYLILIGPTIFIFRDYIAHLPFSNIIRDSSRFLIITSLGFSLATSIFVQKFPNLFVRLMIVALIMLSMSPYIYGRLTKPETILYGASQFGRDQRVRIINAPIEKNEQIIKPYSTDSNILMPTGAFVGTTTDPRFKQAFAEVGDFEALFSPFAGGIFVSDKSSQNIVNFANNFLGSAKNDPKLFVNLARIYGISNIFIRQGLTSSQPNGIDSNWSIYGCQPINNVPSDWAITEHCPVSDPYPSVYSSTHIASVSPESFDEYVKNDANDSSSLIVVVGCYNENYIKDSSICHVSPGYRFIGNPPHVSFTKINREKYLVTVDKSNSPDTDYILVLNQSFHDGWILEDGVSGAKLNYQKIMINELVNGWVVPANNHQIKDNFIIEFYPQRIYDNIFPLSIGVFILTILLSATSLLREAHFKHD